MLELVPNSSRCLPMALRGLHHQAATYSDCAGRIWSGDADMNLFQHKPKVYTTTC